MWETGKIHQPLSIISKRRNKMKQKLLILLLIFSTLFNACGKNGKKFKEKSKGPLDVIYVLSDVETWETLKHAVDTCFSEYGIRTPEFQPFFHTSWYDIGKLKIFARYKNLMVLADLNKEGFAQKLAVNTLPPDHLALAKQDSVNVFSIDDNYARDQVFMLVAGSDMKKVAQHLIDRRETIFARFNRQYRIRYKDDIYDNREQKDMTKIFWNKYQWTFRMPKKFIILKESPDSNFVWIGANLPYRWFSVYWEEGMNTKLLTANGLMEKRQEIGENFYDDVKADTTYLSHYFTKIKDWDALKMTGLWFAVKEAKGGPFISYAFYDSYSDRTFILDMLIFEPSPDKVTDYYRQMEIIANTFTTKYTRDIFN